MSLEVQGNRRYDESQGLVETGGLPSTTAPQAKKPADDDNDEGLLPVILEQYLDRAGVM